MGTVQDVHNEINQLKEHVASEAAQVVAKILALTDEVKALEEKIAAGGLITSADLDGIIGSIKDVENSVDAIVEPI